MDDTMDKQPMSADRQDDPLWIASGLLVDKFKPLFERCETQEEAQRVVDWIMQGFQVYILEQRRLLAAAGKSETP
jgi:hypothetical protein